MTTREYYTIANTAGIKWADLTKHVPAVVARDHHSSRTDAYGFVSSVDTMRTLYDLGYIPVYAAQALPRDKSKTEYTKHTIRLRHRSALTDRNMTNLPAYIMRTLEDILTYEVVYVSSHDGSTKVAFYGGWFRQVCGNGLISGDIRDMFAIKHLGDIANDVQRGIKTLVAGSERAGREIVAMKQVMLTHDEQLAFAQFAIDTRWGEQHSEARALFTPEDYLARIRPQDKVNNLWVVLNVLQEKLIRGLSKRDAHWDKQTVRPIRGIDQQVDMNRALWLHAVDVLAAHGGVQFVQQQAVRR